MQRPATSAKASRRETCLTHSVGASPYPVAMMADLWAEVLGVHIRYEVLPGDLCGLYDFRTQTVFVDSTLTPLPRNSTLMHELGHAFYGHDGCQPRWEREASTWSAKQLIDPEEFEIAATLFEGSVAIANELGVLPRDVDNYVNLVLKDGADFVSSISS